MCSQCQECNCQQSSPSKCICFSIQIQKPYECNCVPQSYTNVQTSDVVEGLLKYNSNLTKYLYKYQQQPRLPEKQHHDTPIADNQNNNKNRGTSIVDDYNLNVLPTDKYPLQQQKQPQQEQQNIRKPQTTDFQMQTSPRNKNNPKKPPKYPPGSDQQKLQKHFKQMAISSRYLPNTGFKKYFGRECFQNYGRNNTTGVADGIIYGNYLKTFNISPHCGDNMPITQQSNKQTLIKGDRNKYQNPKVPETHYGNEVDRKAAEGYHRKPLSNMPQVIQKSKKYEQEQEKFSSMKINDDNKRNIDNQPRKIQNSTRIPQTQNINQTDRIIKNQIRDTQQPRIRIKSPPNQRNQKQPQPFIQTRPDPRYEYKQNNQQVIQSVRGNYGWQNNPILDQISQIQQKQPTTAYRNNQNRPHPQPQPFQKITNKNCNNFKHATNCQRWQDDNRFSPEDRQHMKKQIINSCYNNLQAFRSVEKIYKHPCRMCQARRFTKCCCGS